MDLNSSLLFVQLRIWMGIIFENNYINISKHVVFGELIQGMPLLDRMEKILVKSEDRPKFDIVIENCILSVLFFVKVRWTCN